MSAREEGPLLRPITRENATDACARALTEAILRGEFPVGSRLPSERALAEQLAVHRVTARAACVRLAEAGLVVPVQGSGYWVQDHLRRAGPKLLTHLLALRDRTPEIVPLVADLLRIRRTLIADALELLAERSSTDDRAEVARLASALLDALARRDPPLALARAEGMVVSAIVAATHSGPLALIANPIIDAYVAVESIQEIVYRSPEQTAAGYRVFLEWLAAPRREIVGALRSTLEVRDAETVALLGASLDVPGPALVTTAKPGGKRGGAKEDDRAAARGPTRSERGARKRRDG